MNRLRVLTCFVLVGAGGLACSSILGLRDDYELDEGARDGQAPGADVLLAGDSEVLPDGAPVTCGDTRNDPKNCGACGHDCLGGLCNAGSCTPRQIEFYTGDAGSLFEMVAGGGYLFIFRFGGGELIVVRADGSARRTLTIPGRIYSLAVDEPEQRIFMSLSDGTVLEGLLAPGSGAIPTVPVTTLSIKAPSTIQVYQLPPTTAFRPLVTHDLIGSTTETYSYFGLDGGLVEIGRSPLDDCTRTWWSSGSTFYYNTAREIVTRDTDGTVARYKTDPYFICGGIRGVGDSLFFVAYEPPNEAVARRKKNDEHIDFFGTYDLSSPAKRLTDIAAGRSHFYWAAGQTIYRCPDGECKDPEVVVAAPSHIDAMAFGNARIYYRTGAAILAIAE